MAPSNKVTKSTPKTSPNKASPTKASSASAGDVNVQLLWIFLKQLLNKGQKLDYQAAADKLGLTKNATQMRFCRLKAALEKNEALVQAYQQQGVVNEDTMNTVKVEPGQVTPVKEGSEEAGLIKNE